MKKGKGRGLEDEDPLESGWWGRVWEERKEVVAVAGKGSNSK